MNRPKLGAIATDAFFDNFTLASLFGKLRIPGAPRELVDPRPLKHVKSQVVHETAEVLNATDAPPSMAGSRADTARERLEEMHQSR
jgi:hypothetical protein